MLAKEVGCKYLVRLLIVMDEKESAIGREREKIAKRVGARDFLQSKNAERVREASKG